MIPVYPTIQQHTTLDPSDNMSPHQNRSDHQQRSLAETHEQARYGSCTPEPPIEKHGLSSHAIEAATRSTTSIPHSPSSSNPRIVAPTPPGKPRYVQMLEKLPKPHPNFPHGRAELDYYLFPCTRTWAPASPVDSWPWPPRITLAFLNGHLEWNKGSAGHPPTIKVDTQKDDLMKWFQREAKEAAQKKMALAPKTIQDVPGRVEGGKEFAKDRLDLAASTARLVNEKLQATLASPLPPTSLGRGQEIAEIHDSVEKVGMEEEDDDWENMKEEDSGEYWELVDDHPTRCGDEKWIDGLLPRPC